MENKRHVYEYEFDTSAENTATNVVGMVGQNKRVLELGCGPGSITRILAKQNGCQITGLEIDPDAINEVTPYCIKVIQADLNSSEWPRLLDDSEKFDVVIAADVLEHLYDPWKTLQRMVPLVNSNGYLVISLPHAGHAAVVSCLLNGDFEYNDRGLLDRTHIRFFGLKNIEALFSQANLKIVEARYITVLPEDTEFKEGWSKLPLSLRSALMKCKYSELYQIQIKAVPINYPRDAIALVPPKLKWGVLYILIIRWKRRIGRNMDPQFKATVRKYFGLLGIKL